MKDLREAHDKSSKINLEYLAAEVPAGTFGSLPCSEPQSTNR